MELKLSTSLILLISVVMALVLSTVKVLNPEHEQRLLHRSFLAVIFE